MNRLAPFGPLSPLIGEWVAPAKGGPHEGVVAIITAGASRHTRPFVNYIFVICIIVMVAGFTGFAGFAGIWLLRNADLIGCSAAVF